MSRSQLHGKKFLSREWVFAKLTHIIESRSVRSGGGGPGVVSAAGLLVVGGPGSGKTAFCTELTFPTTSQGRQALLSRRVLAYHFCSATNPESLSVASFIRRLVEQLASSSLISGFADKLEEPDLSELLKPHALQRDPDEAFKRAVVFPLLEIDPPSQPCVLVVDSVDEPQASSPPTDVKFGAFGSATRLGDASDADVSQSIAELLSNHHHLLPQWIILVVTLRRQNKAMARLFTGFKKIALDDVRRGSVVRDVQQYILGRLESEPALRRHLTRDTAPALNLLHIKSNGCLLYVETVLDGIADGSVLLRDIPEIPGTLNGLYLWLCQRLFSRRHWSKVEPLLGILLAARRPTSEEQLLHALKMSDSSLTDSDFARRLQMISKLLVACPEEKTWLLFHTSFAEWLVDVKHCTQRYLVRVAEGHARWALSLAAQGDLLSPQQAADLAFHLGHCSLQPPLEAWHLPLWLLWTKCPLPDQAALEVMVSSLGAQQSDDEDEQWIEESHEVDVNRSQENPEENGVDDKLSAAAEAAADEPASREHCDTPSTSLKAACDMPEPNVERRDSFRQLIDDPEQALFQAVDLGSFSTAKRIVARFTDEISEAALQHALSIAARQGHAPIVALLAESGANPDVADSEGWTPLRAAAWGGHAATVQVLLERGAQVDACDNEARTALRAAAWAGHEEVVRLLLAAGAVVDSQDRQGRTPLIAAAYMGHADIVAALLEAGANPDHADCEGRTALSVAVLSVACRAPQSDDKTSTKPRRRLSIHAKRRKPSTDGTQSDGSLAEDHAPSDGSHAPSDRDHALRSEEESEAVETVAMLLEFGASVNHQDKEGMTPLLVAAFEGHRAICELLLEAEADVDQADSNGRTPLLAAASMGHAHVVELLLFWGCYVDSIDAEGRTVLSVAAAQGNTDVVRKLLDRGLDEAHRDNAGWTPLHYAAFEGHVAVIDLLLDVGARLEATDNDGRSALILPAQEGHLPVVHRLIQVGADVNQRAHDGKTPLRVSAFEGHTHVLSALIDCGADVNYRDADGRTLLYLLTLENKLQEAELLLRCPTLKASQCDPEGRSPLHVAAWQGHLKIVELLLSFGFDVNAVDREQRTPLQSAAWQGHEAVVWLLLQSGARVDQPCSQGASPLSIASQEGHEAVVRLLLAAGADPNRADGCGRTALKLALKGGHTKVAHLLETWTSTSVSINGKDSHTESLQSHASTATVETKPCSALLNSGEVASREYSPSSTFETGVCSNTSSGKSSNLTSSTTRSSHNSMEPVPVASSPALSPLPAASFTQQLQQQAVRGGPRGRNQLALFPRVLSPLSEPQSPLYSTPPPSSPEQSRPAGTEPSLWKVNENGDSKKKLDRNSSYDPSLLRRKASDNANPPLPLRTTSIDSSVEPRSKSSTRPSSSPVSFSQSSHMQIILGQPAKSRRNGFGTRANHNLSNNGNGGLSSVFAGLRNSALLNGSNKLRNALCSVVSRPGVLPLKKETQL